ncbi:DMT family transporter [Kribbella solani]|uniref:DMT family transporter n=1 Tax=Kribbella solani TaxID=236067 RepID=UPI0029A29176|nr:DMT family transporter [Kribbella solani]MDX3001999.1 DMT family transporter [Kribbella solani]
MTTTATRPAVSTRRHQLVGLVAAFGIGMLVAVQSRLNGELGGVLGDGVPAALISFGSGLLLLLIVSALIPRVRHALGMVWTTIRDPGGGLRWWQCLGGIAGAYLVATQSITVSIIGVAVFTVAIVAGQGFASLIVDRAGFGPAGPQPVTPLRVVGALGALAAVVLAVSDQLSHPSGLLLAILPAIGGLGTAVQQAINGRVARTASPDGYGAIAAGVVNFLVGFAALLIVFLADLVVRGAPHHLPSEPWLYFGGACGVIYISAAAVVVRVVGVFILGLATIAGQLIASLAVDLWLPAADKAVTLPVVAGTFLALAAVIVAAVPNLVKRAA